MTDTYINIWRLNAGQRVHIVDADLQRCEGLSALFRLEGFQATFSWEAAHFLANCERHPAHIYVINLRVGDHSGLSLLRHVKAAGHAPIVLMLCDEPDVDATVQAMKFGAHDVLQAPIDNEHMLAVIRDQLRRSVHVGVAAGGNQQIELRGFQQLTPREREVLQLITNGSSNKEAGRDLGISPRTIEVHRARVMSKLGARNTADLMRIVLSS